MFNFGFCWGIPMIFMVLRKSSNLLSPRQPKDSHAFYTTSSKVTGNTAHVPTQFTDLAKTL